MGCPLCQAVRTTPVERSRAQMVPPPAREWFSFVRCLNCGLIRLDPPVPAREQVRYYGDDYLPHRGPAAWGRYGRLVAWSRRREDGRKLRWARRAHRLGLGTRVLDFGCGLPTFLARVREATGAECVGLDPTPGAWQDQDPRWNGLRLHRSTLSEVGPEGPFDLITAWHVLEHDDRPLETLSRLRALTVNGGALIVEVPDYSSLTRRLQGSCWAGWSTPRHAFAFTPATLRRLLETAGWRVRRLARHGSMDPHVLWWLGRQERRGRDLSGSLENRFFSFLAGKVATAPLFALSRVVPMGIQLVIATPD
jgi:SAM-dependent methyltransferase